MAERPLIATSSARLFRVSGSAPPSTDGVVRTMLPIVSSTGCDGVVRWPARKRRASKSPRRPVLVRAPRLTPLDELTSGPSAAPDLTGTCAAGVRDLSVFIKPTPMCRGDLRTAPLCQRPASRRLPSSARVLASAWCSTKRRPSSRSDGSRVSASSYARRRDLRPATVTVRVALDPSADSDAIA